jgi:Ala-tRNA(Pro) deacylase
MRIATFLNQQQVDFESLPHAPAYSAQQLAKHLRLPGARVAKAVLLRGRSSYLLAVLPATHQVDTEHLGRVVGGPVRVATDRESAACFPDCEWGVVPPFGGLYGLETILDEAIRPDSWIVFKAHTTVEAIRLRCADFERLERPRRLRFARKAPEPVRS